MRKLAIVTILLFLAYAAGLGSAGALEDVRRWLADAGESAVAIVGAAAVTVVALVRKATEGATLERILLTVVAALLLLHAWGGRRQPSPRAVRGLEIDGGDDQQGPPNAFLPEALRLRAIRRNGAGIPGVELNFRVVEGDGRLAFPVRTTRDDGACETWFRPGAAAGTRLVEASLTGRPEMAVVFRLDVREMLSSA